MDNFDKYTPVGIVEIYDDETGELVYKTHNMIVKTGRELIMKAIFNLPGKSKDQLYSECNGKIAEIESKTDEADAAEKADLITSFVAFFNSHVDSTNVVTADDYSDMITSSGKLKSKYFAYLIDKDVDSLNASHFRKFCEVGHDVLTTPEMKYDDIKNYILAVTTDGTNYIGTEKVYDPATGAYNAAAGVDDYDSMDTDNLKMNFAFKIKNSSSTQQLTAIGLLYENNDETILFSRADIDPVYMRSSRTYLCKYSIYF